MFSQLNIFSQINYNDVVGLMIKSNVTFKCKLFLFACQLPAQSFTTSIDPNININIDVFLLTKSAAVRTISSR